MVLQANVPLRRLPEVFELCKLAGSNSLVPVITAFDEFEIADAIHADFAVASGHSKIKLIPLSSWPSGIVNLNTLVADLSFEHFCPAWLLWFVKLVEPACFLRIVAVDVVLNLHFRSRLPGTLIFFRDVKHQPTVAALRDSVFKLKLKMLELTSRDDVPCPFADS